MDGHSPEITQQLLEQLKNLVPEAFADGRLQVEALKRALGEEHVLEKNERYHLDWPGKSAAYKLLQAPSSATLRPQPGLSVNFDTAEHVFIEGENLEVLKVLQKAYFGKVKLIYIDPPYNTGSDSFIYPDRFQESKADYLKRINELDDDGQLMREGFFRKNNKENGHYHSNWLNMMLPRLYLARNLLREDGVIFVSIDDNEVHNLRCVMNEIFGEDAWLATLIWHRRQNADSRNEDGASTDHEYVLVYKRANGTLKGCEVDLSKYTNPDNDSRGAWFSADLTGLANKESRPNLHYDVKNPNTGDVYHPSATRGWSCSKETFDRHIQNDQILWPKKPDGRPRFKKFLKDVTNFQTGFSSMLDVGYTTEGTRRIQELFIEKIFPFAKPISLIRKFLEQATEEEDNPIVLDFFAGSGTVFDAVLQHNIERQASISCIGIQIPEIAERDDFHTIADIARERIRRVIQKIHNEADLASPAPDNLGFKSFVLAPSNFKQWRGDDIETAEQLAKQLELFVQSEKEGADVGDILYELLLKAGFPLTTPLERLSIPTLEHGNENVPVWRVNNGELLFVLEAFNLAMIAPLLGLSPKEILCLDSVFQGSDELKTNLDLQCRDARIRFTCV